MLNFVLCDDNPSILKSLSRMLESIFIERGYNASVGFISSDAHRILEYASSNKVDVLILDINLNSDISGLDIAQEIRRKNKDIYIIFVTAYLEYAMVAYKYKTFDFLAKPITLPRLSDTIRRLFEDINGLPKKYIKIDNKNTLIDENSIQYIKRDGMKLIFHSESKDYDTYSSFNKIQDTLPENFIRCHKSYIVNINLIKDVDPVINRICFSEHSFCDIGPKYKKNLMEVLNEYGNII